MSKIKTTSLDVMMTGSLLKRLVYEGGYSVADVQDWLGLSCPQPIYRWFKGQNMPSVDHLFILSQMLGLHMEDFLIQKDDAIWSVQNSENRTYWRKIAAYVGRMGRRCILTV